MTLPKIVVGGYQDAIELASKVKFAHYIDCDVITIYTEYISDDKELKFELFVDHPDYKSQELEQPIPYWMYSENGDGKKFLSYAGFSVGQFTHSSSSDPEDYYICDMHSKSYPAELVLKAFKNQEDMDQQVKAYLRGVDAVLRSAMEGKPFDPPAS